MGDFLVPCSQPFASRSLPLWAATFSIYPFGSRGKYIVEGNSPYALYDHLGYPPLCGSLDLSFSYLASSSILNGNFYLYIFFIKLPIVLADFGVAILIWSVWQKNEKEKKINSSGEKPNKLGKKLVLAYLLSPYTIIIGAVWGMMDDLAVTADNPRNLDASVEKGLVVWTSIRLGRLPETVSDTPASCIWHLFIERKLRKKEETAPIFRDFSRLDINYDASALSFV